MVEPAGGRPLGDRAALAVASVFGLGRAPIAPGTVGSVGGVALAWGLHALAGPWGVVAGAALVTAVGVAAAGRAERILGVTDPGRVVIDEVAGQMVALFFLSPTPVALAAGFLLFRVFDILKPWPASRLEGLPGGSGIMADDLAAGLYANLILQAAFGLWPLGPGGAGAG